jgi:hypothetical protein
VSATRFDLTTDWSLPFPLAALWQALIAPEEWPSWWRAVARVERLAPGDDNGVGAVRRMTWRTALPYTLTFDMRTTRIEPMSLIEGRAEGELTGLGRWTLSPAGDGTRVRYEWMVEMTQPRMRLVAPIARPVFAWNHATVMRWGEEGLRSKLAAE